LKILNNYTRFKLNGILK